MQQGITNQSNTPLFLWKQNDYENFGKKIQCLKHNLDLFDDESLITLLDNYPREWLQCFTMGFNPEDFSEWKAVHIADSTGAEIMEAVKKGRFWINVININKADKHCAEIMQQIYKNISLNSSHLTDISNDYSTLLISSPGIQVYYHLDAEANMLWHLRGRKKIWVYPKSRKFASQDELEKVVAQVQDEEIPFKKEFDQEAHSFTLTAGDVLSWPIHSPHRVENMSVNVSLSSSYSSKQNHRLNAIHCANHFILKKIGIKNRSIDQHTLVGVVKAYSYLVMNKLKFFKRENRTANYKTDLKLDHTHPEGMSTIDKAFDPVFSTGG